MYVIDKSKTRDVYNHLKTYGRINALEAINNYGATRLSAIIFNLRHRYNLNIVNESKPFKDRHGRKSSYDDYVLIEDNNTEISNGEY